MKRILLLLVVLLTACKTLPTPELLPIKEKVESIENLNKEIKELGEVIVLAETLTEAKIAGSEIIRKAEVQKSELTQLNSALAIFDKEVKYQTQELIKTTQKLDKVKKSRRQYLALSSVLAGVLVVIIGLAIWRLK